MHAKVVAGSTDVRLRTDPRTLASVYEETFIGACHCCPCEIRSSGASLVHMQTAAICPSQPGPEVVCVQAALRCLLIGYPGQKKP